MSWDGATGSCAATICAARRKQQQASSSIHRRRRRNMADDPRRRFQGALVVTRFSGSSDVVLARHDRLKAVTTSALLFGARVRFLVALLQSACAYVGVNLGGCQAAVAQEFLDAADVGAPVQQVRRK